MVLESTKTKEIYEGNGLATLFPVPFEYSKADDILLIFTGKDKKEVAITTNFKVTVGGDGETTVLYPVTGQPIDVGTRLTVYRKTPQLQVVDLVHGGAFNPEVLEQDGFDRTVMMVQELQGQVDRAIKVPISSDQTPEELLDDIFGAAEDAAESARQAAESAEKAKQSEDKAKASEIISGEAMARACECATRAEEARDVSIQQVEAANLLMEAELGKINVIVSTNKDDQINTVNRAQAWAEREPGLPVDVDDLGNPLYSARHWANEAQQISVPDATESAEGVVRFGTWEEHAAGASGVAAMPKHVKRMVDGVLPVIKPEDKGKALVAGGTGYDLHFLGRATQAGELIFISGTKLDTNCVWPDRSWVSFADWPDLKARYLAGYMSVSTTANQSTRPFHWIAKDGETVTATRTGLFLPDFGGLFPRFWRAGTMLYDVGRTAGNYQQDAMQGHYHKLVGVGWNSGLPLMGAGSDGSAGVALWGARDVEFQAQGLISDGKNGNPRLGATTYPENVSMPVCIYLGRYKTEV